MNAFFEGLVVDENGEALPVTYVGTTPYYVVNDQGFLRHVEARGVDRYVLEQFLEQLDSHRDEAVAAMLMQLGRDDLFTKAMVDSTLRNLSIDQVIDQGMPLQAREWLGILGFRVVVDVHGDVVRMDMPSAPIDPDELP